jgi:CBS domain-containing protein
MHDRKVGTLVVLGQDKKPLGIVTDRDLAVRVVADAKDATQTTVGEVMTRCPRSVDENTDIESALSLMRAGPFRRLPVVNREGQLIGLLSIDDLLELLVEEFNDIGELVKDEGPGSLANP